VFPIKSGDNPTDEELLHLFNQLDSEQQEEIRKRVRFIVKENKKEERGVGVEGVEKSGKRRR